MQGTMVTAGRSPKKALILSVMTGRYRPYRQIIGRAPRETSKYSVMPGDQTRLRDGQATRRVKGDI